MRQGHRVFETTTSCGYVQNYKKHTLQLKLHCFNRHWYCFNYLIDEEVIFIFYFPFSFYFVVLIMERSVGRSVDPLQVRFFL